MTNSSGTSAIAEKLAYAKRFYESYKSHSTHKLLAMPEKFIPPHGGYENLLSFRKARIVYDGTVRFCEPFLDKRDRTREQMVQAARSGKQNIIEGSQASGTSKEIEIKLMNVARASLEELLEDYRDFLRVRGLPLWDKNSREACFVRGLGIIRILRMRPIKPTSKRDHPQWWRTF